MRLSAALRVAPGRALAFVGAGGKSTAIERLVAEVAEVHPVVVTCTTRLAQEQSRIAEIHLTGGDVASLEALPTVLEKHRSVLITRDLTPAEPKWLGLDPGAMEILRRQVGECGAVLLIEADGARGRSWKAPAVHEPVIPALVDTVVPVVGLDILGKPFTPRTVHRFRQIASLLGIQPGAIVQPEHIVKLMLAEDGGLKGIPPHAEVRVLLNKAGAEPVFEAGQAMAELLLRDSRVRAVALGAVANDPPVRRLFSRVAGVVLAAGGSARLGRSKQLIEWRGKPLVAYAVQAAVEGGLSPVIVVVGADAEAVEAALGSEPVVAVRNAAWASGQSSSVRVGLAAAARDVEAVIFLLSDMPFVGAAVVQTLVKEHQRNLAPIVAPLAGGRWGNPVLFDRVTFSALDSLVGDQGGKALFGRFQIGSLPWDQSVLFDVDSVEDLRSLRERE